MKEFKPTTRVQCYMCYIFTKSNKFRLLTTTGKVSLAFPFAVMNMYFSNSNSEYGNIDISWTVCTKKCELWLGSRELIFRTVKTENSNQNIKTYQIIKDTELQKKINEPIHPDKKPLYKFVHYALQSEKVIIITAPVISGCIGINTTLANDLQWLAWTDACHPHSIPLYIFWILYACTEYLVEVARDELGTVPSFLYLYFSALIL